ncbi:hypothetical protein FRC17_003340 [Serendipita sp. 399]|nr:hypothetical protein FRC17_003340 [Serendipita sp. 399]
MAATPAKPALAPPNRKPLPFWANFTAGAIAGVTEILIMYPLDVVKTRMQLDTGKKSVGLVGSFKNIIAEEGAANDFWSKTYKELFNKAEMNQNLSILTGCSAGATESFVVVPFELVKIKLQDKKSTYAGPMAVVKHIIKTDGFLGLYAGMESTFWRHVWWNGGYFGSIYQVRSMLPKAETPQATLMNNFISGTVGGFIGTAINTPFDVVKSRIQGASKPAPGQVAKYNWTYPALITIAREEGVPALWKGFVPKVLRLAPGGGVLLLVVEFTLSTFRTST